VIRPTAIARRYARALLDLAAERGVEEAWGAELRALAELWASEPVLRGLLTDPLVPDRRKEEVLAAVVEAARPSGPVAALLGEMLGHDRMGRLPEVEAAYGGLLDERRGIVEAEVAAAEELTAKQLDRLRGRLEAITSRRVRLRARRDPGLLGGLVVRIGDLVYDGSLRRRLAQARRSLEGE